MSEIKLKGQTESGEWVEFFLCSTSIYDIRQDKVLVFDNGDPAALLRIDPATIQPADDPRKAMLEEIRQLIKRLSPQHGWFVMLDKLLPALDEMEAKL